MPLIIKAEQQHERKLIPAGQYPARCYGIIDIGTHKDTYQGQPITKREVIFLFEFPTEKAVFSPEKGEQPFVLSKNFTLSLNSKARLRPFLESWRGRAFTEEELEGFDIEKCLNTTFYANIGHVKTKKGSDIADIVSLMPLHPSIECPEAINEILFYTVDAHNDTVYQKLPKWIQDKISSCEEKQI